MKNYLSLTVAIGLLAGPGLAGGLADPIIPAAPPPPPVVIPLDWYVGLQVGPATGEMTIEANSTAFGDTDIDGAFYGIHAGVQRSFGAVTAGVELDYNTASTPFENDDIVDVSADFETLAHLKLRVGGTFGSAFVYGTGGLAYVSGEMLPLGVPVEVSDTAPFYGIGADVMVSEQFSVGAEVLVHDFEDIDGSALDISFTTAMLRVSYHF